MLRGRRTVVHVVLASEQDATDRVCACGMSGGSRAVDNSFRTRTLLLLSNFSVDVSVQLQLIIAFILSSTILEG